MRCRERGIHRQGRHDAAKREHGLNALTRRHHVVGDTEADGVAEEMAHRPPRRVDGGLILSQRVEPGAMRAGDVACEIGDGSNHRRPGLGQRVGIGAIVAARVESQCADIIEMGDPAMAQVELDERAGDRLRHRNQPAG